MTARVLNTALRFPRRNLGEFSRVAAGLHEEGGRQAIVYCATEPACALYQSLGFRIHASLVEYSRNGRPEA